MDKHYIDPYDANPEDIYAICILTDDDVDLLDGNINETNIFEILENI